MKNVEERLRALPELAESMGLEADESLKRRILKQSSIPRDLIRFRSTMFIPS